MKPIIEALKNEIEGFNRIRDVNLALDHLLKNGWLREVKVAGAKTGPAKTILQVVAAAG
ncbi:MAG: hypothetical protein ACYC6G_19490 [Desulfobaccales bacterium]